MFYINSAQLKKGRLPFFHSLTNIVYPLCYLSPEMGQIEKEEASSQDTDS